MSKKWIIGNFITGLVSEVDELPVIAGSGKITLNINNEDYATLSVSKRDLPNPADWKAYLKPAYRLVALVDTSKAWNAEGAVLFAGFIKEVRATAKQTVALQVAGFREYASNRVVVSAPTGQIADPKASKVFSGANWSQVLNAIANGVWDATGLPSAAPKPPTATKGAVGAVSGSTRQAEILNVNTMRFSDALDYVRDELSDKGEEYRFVPRWQNGSKNRIVWDFVVGTSAQPQINKTHTFNVNLDGENYTVGLGNSLSLTDFATRLVGISKQSEDATDLKLYNSGSGADLLIDDVFNPGVELTPAELDTFTTERLNSQKLLQEEGELLVVANADETWRTRVGATVNIMGGSTNPEVSGMTFTMRLVEVSFSDSDTKVETRVMMNKTRYGRLPTSPTNPNRLGQNPSLNTGGMGGPITPKLPDNTPPIGGGGGIPLPDFGGNPLYPSTHTVFSDRQSNIYANFSYAVRNNMRSNEFYWVLANVNANNGDGGQADSFGTRTTQSLSHASWEDCDAYFETVPGMASMLDKNITIMKATVNGTHNFPQTSLFTFKYSDYLTLEDFEDFDGKAGAYMEHSSGAVLHGAKIYTRSFIDNDTYYLAVFLIKFVARNQSNIAYDALHTQSHKIFKNSISTGTSSTWEDTGWDNAFRDPDDGKPLLPTDSKDIVVRNGKLWMASGVKYKDWVYKNIPNFWSVDYADIKRDAGSTPPAHEWQDPLIKNGIYSLNLTTGTLEKETNSTFTDLSSVLFMEKTGTLSYKPMSWPSGAYTWTANPNSTYRLRDAGVGQEIILLQTPGVGGQGLGNASLAAGLNNFVRVGRLRLLPGQPPQTVLLAEANLGDTGFSNGSSGVAVGSIEDWIVLVLPDGRCWWTRNSGGSFIESSEDPSYAANMIKTALPNIDTWPTGFAATLNSYAVFDMINAGGSWIFSAGGRAYNFTMNYYNSYTYDLNFS